MTPATFDAALAAVRNVGDGPRLLEQANRIADRVEAENTELRRRIDTASALLREAHYELSDGCGYCRALDILGGGT
jgi:hypothetical protein